MKKITAAFLMVLSSVLSAANESGTSSLQFLSLARGAKAAGIAESMTAVTGDLAGLNYNPAGIYNRNRVDFSAGHSFLLSDMQMLQLSGKYKFDNAGDAALGVAMLFSGDIQASSFANPASPQAGLIDGAVSKSTSFDISAAYSQAFISDRLMLGGGVKTSIENLGTVKRGGFLFNAGSILNLGIIHPILSTANFGVSLGNLGFVSKADLSTHPSPFALRGGFSFNHWISRSHQLLYALDAEKVKGNQFSVNLGTRYTWKKLLYVSAGWKLGQGKDGFKFGSGVMFSGFDLAWSMDYVAGLGNTQRVELSWGIAAKEKELPLEALYLAGVKSYGKRSYENAERYFSKLLKLAPAYKDAQSRLDELKEIRLKIERLKAFEESMKELE